SGSAGRAAPPRLHPEAARNTPAAPPFARAPRSRRAACARAPRGRARSAAAGHGRDHHDLAPLRNLCGTSTARARVILADVHVDIGAQLAFVVQDPRGESGMTSV